MQIFATAATITIEYIVLMVSMLSFPCLAIDMSPKIEVLTLQVVLQFLLDYPLGKGLHKHINFFLDNLDYKAQDGRESIYEMIGAMLSAFPQVRTTSANE